MSEDFTKEFMSFLQQKGFIWGPSPEIYGGLAGFYTYGPLGKLLKQNVEQKLRHDFQQNNLWEVECPTIMQKEVWEASGHLGGFTDPMIKCSKCKAAFRADALIHELFPAVHANQFKTEQDLLTFFKENALSCPNCKGAFDEHILRHDLMMRTTIGVDIEAYNRPETATTTYLPFPRYYDFFRKKLPFGVFQIGKAYRNEISPRQHVLRCREFTQAEAQLFIFPHQKNEYYLYEKVKDNKLPLWPHQHQDTKKEPEWMSLDTAIKLNYLRNKAYSCMLSIAYTFFADLGIPKEKIRCRQHHKDEKAFYADDAWDIEIELHTFGWTECCGVHDRTDYDLKQHEKKTGVSLDARGEDGATIHPHILEMAFGSDRIVFALLDIFYTPAEKGEGKPVLKIPYPWTPVNVAVLPLMKKDGLAEYAQHIHEMINVQYVSQYDESGTVGRRYLRQDEAGTAYCITIDYESLQNKDVTLRDRDTGMQIRVPEKKLISALEKLFGGAQFNKQGKVIQHESERTAAQSG